MGEWEGEKRRQENKEDKKNYYFLYFYYFKKIILNIVNIIFFYKKFVKFILIADQFSHKIDYRECNLVILSIEMNLL